MLVDEKNQFLTQREFPVMATVRIDIDGDRFTAAVEDSEIRVPLNPSTNEFHTAKIWKSTVRSEFYPAEVDDWFSAVLGTNCRLVAMPEGAHRAVNPFHAVRRFKDNVSYADGYPFMIISRASLDDLNSRL